MSPLVSVIVPIYNVEKYVEKCITSIIHQTYSNLEIILVDDGSSDNSSKICNKYACSEKIIVIHKQNGGLSDARNTGLDICKGDYISFVDGDDYIQENMIEKMVNLAILGEYDVVSCCFRVVYKDKVIEKMERYPYHNFQSPYQKSKMISDLILGKYGGATVCSKLFKRDVIKNERFMIGKYYEDAYFFFNWLTNTNKIAFINECLYNYVQHNTSITGKKFSEKDFDNVIAWEYNNKLVKEKYPECIEAADYALYSAHRKLLERLISLDKNREFKEKLFEEKNNLLNYFSLIFSNKYMGIKDVIAIFLLCCNSSIYKFFKRIFISLKYS